MFKSSLLVIVLAYVAYYVWSKQIVPSPVVNTTYGQVQGAETWTRDGKKIFEYLGLPYAAYVIERIECYC